MKKIWEIQTRLIKLCKIYKCFLATENSTKIKQKTLFWQKIIKIDQK